MTTYAKYSRTRRAASQACIHPSYRMKSSVVMETVKNVASRKNGPRLTRKGLMMHMEPTIQETMKDAAPKSSPIAKPPAFERRAENVANTSGLPFPNARRVTPATFSSRLRSCAIVAKLGQKKSEALMPRVENRKPSQSRRPTITNGRAVGLAQR